MENMNIQHTTYKSNLGFMACALLLTFLGSAGFGDFGHRDRWASGLCVLSLDSLVWSLLDTSYTLLF